MIPFKTKLLTETAKAPTQENEGDLWDLYADNFYCYVSDGLKEMATILEISEDGKSWELYDPSKYKKGVIRSSGFKLGSGRRVLIKTGIAIELPILYDLYDREICTNEGKKVVKFLPTKKEWLFHQFKEKIEKILLAYAVADIRPRSGLALKHGITVLNTPGTIDNSYRKEIGVILYNAGHEPYTINKGDKIAQMLIRPLYPSKMEIVENIEDTQRGGYGSTGK
jgi:dUTPase